jgi:hypothetical protein
LLESRTLARPSLFGQVTENGKKILYISTDGGTILRIFDLSRLIYPYFRVVFSIFTLIAVLSLTGGVTVSVTVWYCRLRRYK